MASALGCWRVGKFECWRLSLRGWARGGRCGQTLGGGGVEGVWMSRACGFNNAPPRPFARHDHPEEPDGRGTAQCEESRWPWHLAPDASKSKQLRCHGLGSLQDIDVTRR